MNNLRVLVLHLTKRAAMVAARTFRTAGIGAFVMRGDDAARFLGVVVGPRVWVVYK